MVEVEAIQHKLVAQLTHAVRTCITYITAVNKLPQKCQSHSYRVHVCNGRSSDLPLDNL